jgi:hypothetical protein
MVTSYGPSFAYAVFSFCCFIYVSQSRFRDHTIQKAIHNFRANQDLEIILYKKPSIISGTGASIWSKTNFGPTGHHHTLSSPLPCICTIHVASPIFKCIQEVVFCKGIQHSLWFCVSIWLVGTAAMLFLVKNYLVTKEVWNGVLMQQPILLSPMCRIYCLACQDEFFVNNPLDVKVYDDFALHLSCPYWFRWVWTFPVWLMLSSLNACLIIAMACIFSEICTKSDAIPLSYPAWNRIRPRYTTPNKKT